MGNPLEARVLPLPMNDERLHPWFAEMAKKVGYEPAAIRTMAKKSGLVEPIFELGRITVNAPDGIEPALRRLVCCEAARTARSYYSAVHLAHAANTKNGIAWEKICDLPNYPDSPLFSEREKVALRIASAGATLPVGDVDAALDAAKRLLSEDEIIELVATISFLCLIFHWNDIMGTEIEDVPAEALQHVPWLSTLASGS